MFGAYLYASVYALLPKPQALMKLLGNYIKQCVPQEWYILLNDAIVSIGQKLSYLFLTLPNFNNKSKP